MAVKKTTTSSSSSSSTTTTGAFSFTKFADFVNEYFMLLLIGALLFGFSFWLGMLYKENAMLKGGSRPAAAAPAAPTAGDPAAPTAPSGPTADQLAQAPAPGEGDYFRGSKDAKVVLVEYSDYECPFCSRIHPSLQQVVEEYDEVAWVYRHYPLSFHPNAQKSAEAAECVGSLGGETAFWEFGDILFENQDSLNLDNYVAWANDVGVNGEAVRTCVESGEMAEAVNSDFNSGQSAGVTGTPGTIVFVDGEAQELIPGALPYESIKQTVDQYL